MKWQLPLISLRFYWICRKQIDTNFQNASGAWNTRSMWTPSALLNPPHPHFRVWKPHKHPDHETWEKVGVRSPGKTWTLCKFKFLSECRAAFLEHYEKNKKLFQLASLSTWKVLLVFQKSPEAAFLEAALPHNRMSLKPSTSWVQKPLYTTHVRRQTHTHTCLLFAVIKIKTFHLLSLCCVPKSRFKQLRIRKVRECRKEGKAARRQ